MDDSLCARLTPAQREALRLVSRNMDYKEIARELGIRPDAVNKRIAAAMRTLGVSSRRQAARLLQEWEEASTQPLVTQPLAVEGQVVPEQLEPSSAEPDTQPDGGQPAVAREDRPNFDFGTTDAWRRAIPPLHHVGDKRNDLSPIEMAKKAVLWAGAVAIIFLVFLAVFDQAGERVRALIN